MQEIWKDIKCPYKGQKGVKNRFCIEKGKINQWKKKTKK